MAAFKTQIQDLIGDFDDDVAINQFLTDGAKELINMMPPELKQKCSKVCPSAPGFYDRVHFRLADTVQPNDRALSAAEAQGFDGRLVEGTFEATLGWWFGVRGRHGGCAR